MSHCLIGVFSSANGAARAKAALIDIGTAENALAMSADYATDGIAAEAPGQAYEYPPGMPETGAGRGQCASIGMRSHSSMDAKLMADVQRGSCVLTVDGVSRLKLKRVREILTRNGAVVVRER